MQTAIPRDYNYEARELRALFEKQLKELYWAENVMVNMLDNVILNVASKDLAGLLHEHVVQTKTHIKRLDRVFDDIGITTGHGEYKAVKCLIEEAEDFINNTSQGVVRDAGIIAVLQKIKHYEIACYGTMRAYAIALREEEVVILLEQTLEEEKGVDLLLSAVAESHINIEAADKEI